MVSPRCLDSSYRNGAMFYRKSLDVHEENVTACAMCMAVQSDSVDEHTLWTQANLGLFPESCFSRLYAFTGTWLSQTLRFPLQLTEDSCSVDLPKKSLVSGATLLTPVDGLFSKCTGFGRPVNRPLSRNSFCRAFHDGRRHKHLPRDILQSTRIRPTQCGPIRDASCPKWQDRRDRVMDLDLRPYFVGFPSTKCLRLVPCIRCPSGSLARTTWRI